MSDTLETLRGKIGGAEDLNSVVRSMKSLAAASIGQYEKSVLAVGDYYRTVELGLAVCLRQSGSDASTDGDQVDAGPITAVVFGSDQGLVGQFNDVLADFVVRTLTPLPGAKRVWAVGERVHARLTDAGLTPTCLFSVPTSVDAITPLVGQILIETEAQRASNGSGPLSLFHNAPRGETLYEPQSLRLLPLDRQWRRGLRELHWPTGSLPEVVGDRADAWKVTLRALIREYLFVSLFRACAESLASENASRLAAMQRAEKNIDDMLDGLHQTYNHQRQSSIDEEMFDVIAGFESQKDDPHAKLLETRVAAIIFP